MFGSDRYHGLCGLDPFSKALVMQEAKAFLFIAIGIFVLAIAYAVAKVALLIP